MGSQREAPLRIRILSSIEEQKKRVGSRLLVWSISDRWTTGLPDIHGVYDGRFFALELKAADGEVAKRQREWLLDMGRAGGYCAVIRTNKKAPFPLRAQLTEYNNPTPMFLTGDWLLSRLEGVAIT